MKLVLIGFMASGKSSTALELSKRLGLECFDVDALILERSGNASISELFSTYGETHFRTLELDTIESLRYQRKCIISPGGGAVLNGTNVAALGDSNGIFIYLKTSFEEVKRRLIVQSSSGTIDRPLFEDEENARTLYAERLSTYQKLAAITVETDGRSVSQVVEQIIKVLEDGGYLL